MKVKYSFFLLILLLLLLPVLAGANYYMMHLVISTLIFVIVAMGLNMLLGFAGQISVGHAGFYALGAYTSALVTAKLSLPFPVAVLLSMALTGLVGLGLGITCLRLRMAYLAIATVGFGEVVQIVLTQWEGLTGGPEGLLGIPYASIGSLVFKSMTSYYYLVLFCVLAAYFVARNIMGSKVGRALMSLRDDIVAANIIGINTTKYKLVAFVLSAVYAGVAGSLYAHFNRALLPDYFSLTLSNMLLMMVVVGGMGTLFGPVLGAAVVNLGFEVLRPFAAYQMIIYGAVIIIVTTLAPKGLFGGLRYLADPVVGAVGAYCRARHEP